MLFFSSAAVGLGLLSVHVEAVVVPVVNAIFPGTTVTVVSTPFPVTITITATPLPTTVTTTVYASLLNSTALTNSTNSTTTSSTTLTSTTSIILTSIIPTVLPTNPPTSGLTADQQKALDLHNKYRADVNNGALVWDDALAKSAQEWADHLTSVGKLVHDDNTGGQGENLALQSGGTSTFYSNAVQLWLDEKKLYDNKPIRTDGSPTYHEYGHYTQAIWKSTKKVGLALATDSKGTNYVVARYEPAGNIIGQMPY